MAVVVKLFVKESDGHIRGVNDGGSAIKDLRGRTGQTMGGHLRYVKVERIGRVTIYKRGGTYSLYYREGGETVRRPIDGNLTTARATITPAPITPAPIKAGTTLIATTIIFARSA